MAKENVPTGMAPFSWLRTTHQAKSTRLSATSALASVRQSWKSSIPELEKHVIDKPKPFYKHSSVKNDQPDVWFEARLVWEVKTADLTLSPRYMAAMEEDGSEQGDQSTVFQDS